jgi:hypothetical protein
MEICGGRDIPERRLKIWRFDPRTEELTGHSHFANPCLTNRLSLSVCLFDLDGDGRKEILVQHIDGSCWVFQWREGKLKMWQGKNDFRYDETIHGQISLETDWHFTASEDRHVNVALPASHLVGQLESEMEVAGGCVVHRLLLAAEREASPFPFQLANSRSAFSP